MKESIVLTKAPEGNVLKFHFKAKGLTPKKNAMDGGISFLDEETDEIVASLEAPNIQEKHTVRNCIMTLNRMEKKIPIF